MMMHGLANFKFMFILSIMHLKTCTVFVSLPYLLSDNFQLYNIS